MVALTLYNIQQITFTLPFHISNCTEYTVIPLLVCTPTYVTFNILYTGIK